MIQTMNWNDVEGYFSYTNLYDIALKHCPDNSTFVEVAGEAGAAGAVDLGFVKKPRMSMSQITSSFRHFFRLFSTPN